MNVELLRSPLMPAASVRQERWLTAFHMGSRIAVEQCYREHHRMVAALVGRMLPAADAETVTHEVFYRLLSDARLRQNFRGGNFAAWLARVATNSAIDHLRRCRHEQADALARADVEVEAGAAARRVDEELEAKLLVERFRRECLPPKWAGVFDARFLRRLTQREAAQELGMRRTTLVYQEHRIRALLTTFLLGAEER